MAAKNKELELSIPLVLGEEDGEREYCSGKYDVYEVEDLTISLRDTVARWMSRT